jgi:hypothetical protein
LNTAAARRSFSFGGQFSRTKQGAPPVALLFCFLPPLSGEMRDAKRPAFLTSFRIGIIPRAEYW